MLVGDGFPIQAAAVDERLLEIGTLGAYSTIWLARALPADGRLVTLEAEPSHAAVARANIERAGLGKMVDMRLGPALETLPQLASRSIELLRAWLQAREWTDRQREVAGHLIEELEERVEVLHRVGLDYLTLDRQARTLSGGEAQRIHLSAALGSLPGAMWPACPTTGSPSTYLWMVSFGKRQMRPILRPNVQNSPLCS